jgi:hypothetical protein
VILGSVLNIAHKFGISALYSPNSFLSENEKEEAQKMHTIIGQIHGAVAEYNACIDLVATKTDLPVNQYKVDLEPLAGPEIVNADRNTSIASLSFRC